MIKGLIAYVVPSLSREQTGRRLLSISLFWAVFSTRPTQWRICKAGEALFRLIHVGIDLCLYHADVRLQLIVPLEPATK